MHKTHYLCTPLDFHYVSIDISPHKRVGGSGEESYELMSKILFFTM